ncbi:sensor domain-containing protein [Nocardioides sp. GY 10113]|uniref:sensor histidine kinase n=1 Tax=Nocardioides sp. GY 10113 TaxID=2569761 RepID=UPI001458C587|nr:sensor domain-containing protein [Nocardioides sp. GY 10113]
MDEDAQPRVGRLAVTGYAALQVLLFPVVVVVFVLCVVSAVLVVVWVGIPLLVAVLPAARALAGTERALASRVLGAPLSPPYLPLPPGALAGLRARAADPATWRDLLWMLWAMTLGFAISLVVLVLMLAVVTLPIWWYGAVPLMRLRSAVDRAVLCTGRTERLERRVDALTRSRATVVDHSAAELRRIERDLHDGPQARMAAVALGLGLADDLFEDDPDAARRLVQEARSTSSSALQELRGVVRGIHPPVLADRGLGGAVSALALDMAIPVEVSVGVPDRLPPPVESAVYFAVAECLANVGKHARASQAWVTLQYADGVLRGEVGDDGRGGARPGSGSGLSGIAARLAAFDGTMEVSSPAGGPTVVRWEVPCGSSSPRTTRS